MITLVYTDASGAFDSINFDATLRELHTGTAQATEHPVERGANRTDHVRPDRARVSCDVFVTNTPIGNVAEFLGGAKSQMVLQGTTRKMTRAAQVSANPTAPFRLPGVRSPGPSVSVQPAQREDATYTVAGNVLQFPERFDRVRDVYGLLEVLRQGGTQLQVITSLRTYPDMVLTSLSAPVTVDDAITFSLELTEMLTADNELVDDPEPVEHRAEPVKPQGPKATYGLEPQEESIAHVGFEKAMKIYSRDKRAL